MFTAHHATVVLIATTTVALLLPACSLTETSRAVQVETTRAAGGSYTGARLPIAVGKFDNRSGYLRGVFSDGVDRLGNQAKTTLISHLQQAQRFEVQERDNLAETGQEAKLQGAAQRLTGASYLITGDVTEFGRKDVGDRQLFGVFGRGKSQIAYAKVTLNVVNSVTAQVVYSARGAGEYALSEREVLGFGSTAGYDATLNGKVLDLAMREGVDNLVAAMDAGQWGKDARQ